MPEIKIQISPKVILGSYEISRIGSETEEWGQKAMIICERSLRDKGRSIQEHLEASGVDSLLYTDTNNGWSTLNISDAVSIARNGHVDFIVGFGGFKALCMARAVATVAGSHNPVEDLYEEDMVLKYAMPYIEVPSTGRNPLLFRDICTLVDSRSKKARFVPIPKGTVKVTIIDPTLMLGISHKGMFSILMESLLFSIESYLSSKSSFFSDSPALSAVQKYVQTLEALVENPEAPFVRDMACEAAVFSSFSQSITGITPGTFLSYSTSAFFGVPKSSVSVILFPYIFESSLYSSSEKMKRVLSLFSETPEDLAGAIRKFIGYYDLPSRLSSLGVRMEDLSSVADITYSAAAESGSGTGKEEFFSILKEAF